MKLNHDCHVSGLVYLCLNGGSVCMRIDSPSAVVGALWCVHVLRMSMHCLRPASLRVAALSRAALWVYIPAAHVTVLRAVIRCW